MLPKQINYFYIINIHYCKLVKRDVKNNSPVAQKDKKQKKTIKILKIKVEAAVIQQRDQILQNLGKIYIYIFE